MEITSKNNSFIKQLIKEKAKNRFLLFLDTPNLVKEALKSNLKLKYLLVEKDKSFSFLSNQDKEKIVYVSKHILESFSKVKTFAGIVGVFEITKRQYSHPKGNFLVLDNVQEAGNVGTLLRTAQATNFNQVYLLDCASISNPKTIRASAGAIFHLEIYEISKSDFLKNLSSQTLFLAVLDGENALKTTFPNNIGLVLGNEGNGVSKEFISLENSKKITLPMANNLESLNVAVSGSVIMYQINKNF